MAAVAAVTAGQQLGLTGWLRSVTVTPACPDRGHHHLAALESTEPAALQPAALQRASSAHHTHGWRWFRTGPRVRVDTVDIGHKS